MTQHSLVRFSVALACVTLLTGAPARAQDDDDDTGGSFESSDWGSSDTSSSSSGSSDWGSSSGSSDWGSSDSSSSGSSDWGSTGASYPRTDYDTSPSSGSYAPGAAPSVSGLLCLFAMIALFVSPPILFALLARQWMRSGARGVYADATPTFRVLGPSEFSPGLVDVSMLQLAVDWRARAFVQAELAKLATEGDTASKEGRVRLLRATTSSLLRVKLAWLYAGARNYRPMPKQQAQREFQQIANDVRASFRQEIVRAANGRVVTVEAKGRARSTDGPGVVLVSVIVASRREIFDVDHRRSASIEVLLQRLAQLGADDVIALSVVWTPAAEGDRMSTDELEARHRTLVRIGDIGGRVFCGYCGGPHAEEITTCPHCGAPSEPKKPA